jgi:hypothetical protein
LFLKPDWNIGPQKWDQAKIQRPRSVLAELNFPTRPKRCATPVAAPPMNSALRHIHSSIPITALRAVKKSCLDFFLLSVR